jgi:catechol 2,3-dioxygenase-like lactoylglutathione lyase family enzyme
MAFKMEHVHLKSRDPAKTARFYIENFGATLVEATHGDTRFRLDLHGLTLNVTGFIEYQKREQRYGIEHLSLQTDDMDGALAKIEASDGRLLEQLTVKIRGRERRVAFVESPDGIQVELVEM